MLILSKPTATKEQVVQFLKNTESTHPLAYAIVPMIYDKAVEKGINPVVAVAQSLKETGYFNFKGVLNPSYCNICGLKGSFGGGDFDANAHKRFNYWEEGVAAFIDHLALYAGAAGYPKYSKETEYFYYAKGTFYNANKFRCNGQTLDTRHFPYLLGNAKTVEELSGKWCPSATYGQDIVVMVRKIENTKVNINNLNDKDKVLQKIKELEDIARGDK